MRCVLGSILHGTSSVEYPDVEKAIARNRNAEIDEKTTIQHTAARSGALERS